MSLHIKLSRTAKALASWDIKQIPLGKLTAIICREIAQLDKVQEDRILSAEETQLKKLLKSRILDLAAIERSRAKQRSRINWIREGDANTKKNHIMASSRRRNNYIALLSNGSETATSQADKHQMIFQHFQNHIGTCSPRSHGTNFAELGWLPQQLNHLDLPFTQQEVEKTIKSLPKQKSIRS
jgi:hypothetical protein